MAVAKRKKNLTPEDIAKIEAADKKYGGKHVMLEGGLIIATETTQDSDMVAKGWASSADKITDEARGEYEAAMKKPAKPVRLK